jgi:rRNA maturation RNase YbeY
LPIYFHREGVVLELNESNASNWIEKSIIALGLEPSEISIIFCDDEYLRIINTQYLGHNYYTDIITFDYSSNNQISGDLFVSTDRVIENAHKNNVTFIDELYRVIIHGVLHLCGFNDKSDEEKVEIRKKENYFLNLIN